MICAGSVTPQGRSPPSSSVTPVFGGAEDLTELLRASPGIDFSKLQIKHEIVRVLRSVFVCVCVRRERESLLCFCNIHVVKLS